MDRKIIDYLPNYLQEIEEFKEIMGTEQKELEQIEQSVWKVLENSLVSEADEFGVRRWEKVVGLSPVEGDTHEARRNRVLSKMNVQLPYTIRMLLRSLEVLCKTEGYSLELFADCYRLTVKVHWESKQQFNEVRTLLYQIVPANLVTLLVSVSFLEFRWKNGVELRKVIFRMNCDWMDALKFDGRFRWDGTRRFHALESKRKNSLYEVRTGNQMTFSAEENVTATIVTKKNVWRFDGSYRMNGVQKWNAYQKEEEL